MRNGGNGIDRRDFLRMAGMGALAFTAPGLITEAVAALPPSPASVTLEQVRLAAGRLQGNIQRTPLVHAGMLAKKTGTHLYLKLENMQYTGAFKERGALNKMATLSAGERAKGVIAASAGNHSQGVAHHATRMGIPSVIAMPKITPNSKIARTRSLGAEVIVVGDSFDESLAFALKKAKDDGLTFIHPFDDPMVVAGQGTVGLEILQDLPEIDVLLVPIGGGGLIAGCATAAKALKPSLHVYGIEPKRYSAMYQLLHDQPVSTGGETLAEGLAVHAVGKLPYSIVKRLVDDVLIVDEDSIAEAITLLFKQRKIVAEGAGAVGVAALLQHDGRFAGKRVATVITGGNIDARIYANLLHRKLAHDGQLVQMRVISPGQGDIYPQIATMLAGSGAKVVNLQFDPIFHAVSPKSPAYIIVLETRDMQHAQTLVEHFHKNGFEASLMQ